MVHPSPSTAPPVPRRTKEAWAFAFLVGLAGGLVGACYGGILGPARPSAPLTLAPYLDPSWTNFAATAITGAVASSLTVALGLAAFALALFCDAVIRRAFLAPNPAAGALAAALVLLAAAWGGVLKIAGHEGILAGSVLAPVGCLLILEGRGAARWVGGLLAILAAVAHPAWTGVAVAVIACAWPARRQGVAIALLAAAVPVLFAVFRASPVLPGLGWSDRLVFAARDVAAAPILAFSPSRGLDVPTGYDSLVSSAPVIAGMAVQALVLGVGMMIGGIARGLVAAASAAVGIFAAALLVPGWIPGDRAIVLPAMIAQAPIAALVLCTVPPRFAKGVMPGLIVGVGVIAVLLAWERAPRFWRIAAVVDIAGVRDFAREPDLARLVLYLNDVTLRDADAAAVVAAADKLVESRAPALFPDRLKSILDQLAQRAGKTSRSPEFERLVAEVTDDFVLVERLWRQSASLNFGTLAETLVQTSPKVLELFFRWRTEPETGRAVQAFVQLARDIAPVASRSGMYEHSIPLLEAMRLMGIDDPETAGTIAIQRTLSGDLEQGRKDLEAALARLAPRSPTWAFVRGLLGVTILAAGDPAAALRELQSGWSVIGAGGVASVPRTIAVDTVDYYVIAEMLLARYEAAKVVDPVLAPQAARDLAELLKAPLSFGPRRVPALAIMGRLELLQGNRDRALRLLREARKIPSVSFEDRGDGPVGRIAHPRYRRLALETLLLALGDDAGAAAERDEVRAELSNLDGK